MKPEFLPEKKKEPAKQKVPNILDVCKAILKTPPFRKRVGSQNAGFHLSLSEKQMKDWYASIDAESIRQGGEALKLQKKHEMELEKRRKATSKKAKPQAE